MTGAVQTRSMPQWNPRKQLFELPVLGVGRWAFDLRNLDGQSRTPWLESKEGLQWWLLAICGEVINDIHMHMYMLNNIYYCMYC